MSEVPSVFEYEYNVGDAEAPKPLPVGEYKASVKNVEAQRSKNTGNEMLKITYMIDADQYPIDYQDGSPDGTPITVYITTDPNVINKEPRNRFLLKQFCERHGVSVSKRLNAPDFMGAEVIMSVTHKDYQGVLQANGNVVRSA